MSAFRGTATLSTWLVRIVVNEARQRLRNRKFHADIDAIDADVESTAVVSFAGNADPVLTAARLELRFFLERAIDTLAPRFRSVFMLRELEECSQNGYSPGLRVDKVPNTLIEVTMVMTPEQGTTAIFDAHRGLARKIEGILWFSRRSADSRKASKLVLAVEEQAWEPISPTTRKSRPRIEGPSNRSRRSSCALGAYSVWTGLSSRISYSHQTAWWWR